MIAHEHIHPAAEREFADIHPAFTRDEAVSESLRCVYCYDAPCITACPTSIDIPSFIKKIATGNLKGSARVILEANPIGATCARVCPVEVLCEGSCVEKKHQRAPIQIGRLQRYATDWLVRNASVQLFTAGAATGKKVAVVGAGPAGVSAARELARMGHKAVVFDERELPGGLDTYAMAEYKMKKEVSLQEVEWCKQLGVEFRQKVRVGQDVRLADLEKEFQAIFLGVGLGATNKLGIPGEDLPGVYEALTWIEKIKVGPYAAVPVSKVVVTIGAGNTAIDCVTQAKSLGAEQSIIVYRRGEEDMPAYNYEYELALGMACDFMFHSTPVRIEGNGKVERLIVRKKDGSEAAIACGMVLKALGQQKRESFLNGLGIGLEGGKVVVDKTTMQTSNPKYFAGGDCVNGGAEAVNAAADGKIAAKGIDTWLSSR